MTPSKQSTSVLLISVLCFWVSPQVYAPAQSQSFVYPLDPSIGPAISRRLQNLEPAFPQILLKLQAPVGHGQNLDQAFLQQQLSDRSPEVFLTFDDGPSTEATGYILDLLKQHDIKATFFVLGSNVIRLPDVVQRIVSEGHELALHSHTHPNLLTLTREQKEAEIAQSLSLLHWYFPDLRIRWFRPPYGKYDQEVIDIARDYGMCIAMFNEISTDSNSSVGEIARVVLKSRGKVMVFHDGQWPRMTPMTEPESRLLAGLNISLGVAKAQGAQFLTLSSHFGRFCP
ncbi:MAG: polysaccharide deacetylase family protein [Cyanobacteria bacterium P01_H01_bin.152]